MAHDATGCQPRHIVEAYKGLTLGVTGVALLFGKAVNLLCVCEIYLYLFEHHSSLLSLETLRKSDQMVFLSSVSQLIKLNLITKTVAFRESSGKSPSGRSCFPFPPTVCWESATCLSWTQTNATDLHQLICIWWHVIHAGPSSTTCTCSTATKKPSAVLS